MHRGVVVADRIDVALVLIVYTRLGLCILECH